MEDRYRSGAYSALNPDLGGWDGEYKASEILRILQRNSVSPKTICDVGCGSGFILSQLANAMPQAGSLVGYDIRPDVRNTWLEYSDSRLHFRTIDFLAAEDRYDVVMLVDVLEHLENPFEMLRAIRRRCRYCVLHVPLDLSAQAIVRDKLVEVRAQVGHLHWFTRGTLLATLTDAGFRTVDYHYTAASIALPPRTWRTRLARLPRKLSMRVRPDLGALVLGGTSLMVLATPRGENPSDA